MGIDRVAQVYLSDEQFFFDALQRVTGFSRKTVRSIQNRFPHEYRRRWFYKEGHTPRPLSIPKRCLRAVQDFLQKDIIQHLHTHDVVHGYRKKRNIVTAVESHAGAAILVCLDAQHFFESITADAVEECLLAHGACKKIASLITALCTDEGRLPQGTPTSPSLSNAVAFPLDCRCAEIAKKHGFVYTRYVDDLLFSTPDNKERTAVRAFLDAACAAVREGGYGIQTQKFKLVKAHQRQEALGLTLNAYGADGKACKLPVRVNRAFKRRLRAALHQMETRGTAKWNVSQVQGAQSFIRMVEGDP